MILAGLALLGWQIKTEVVSSYQQEKKYFQLWELADKSSTIPAKQKYIEQFSEALQHGYASGEFASHNAIWLQTPNNAFEANLDALRSLAERLQQIQGMSPNSFEYNTAIQQITAQEQGEAKAMTGVFGGCYELANYPIVWCWIGGIFLTVEIGLILIGGFLWLNDF